MSRSGKTPTKAKAKAKKMDGFKDLEPTAYASGPKGTVLQHALEEVGRKKTLEERSSYWKSIQESAAFNAAGD